MILYLSTAMVMMVREDMYTATQGKVFIILELSEISKNVWIKKDNVTTFH